MPQASQKVHASPVPHVQNRSAFNSGGLDCFKTKTELASNLHMMYTRLVYWPAIQSIIFSMLCFDMKCRNL